MILSTTPQIEGCTIREYKGVVTGETIIGARTMDGVKRRTRAGMGRCQAGFCTPRTMEILSRELGIPMTEVSKKGKGSELLVGKIKED